MSNKSKILVGIRDSKLSRAQTGIFIEEANKIDQIKNNHIFEINQTIFNVYGSLMFRVLIVLPIEILQILLFKKHIPVYIIVFPFLFSLDKKI